MFGMFKSVNRFEYLEVTRVHPSFSRIPIYQTSDDLRFYCIILLFLRIANCFEILYFVNIRSDQPALTNERNLLTAGSFF